MFRRVYCRTGVSILTAIYGRYMQVLAMPALSPTMEAGTIIEWSKKLGEKVAVGESFCKLETDKATVSFDNQDDDLFIARIIAEPGSVVKVGDPVCIVVDNQSEINGDEIKKWKSAGGSSASAAPAATVVKNEEVSYSQAQTTSATSAKGGDSDRIFASPAARKLAKEMGVPLDECVGTGGTVHRITKEDVIHASAAPKKPAAVPFTAPAVKSAHPPSVPIDAIYEDLPISNMRAVIAKRLHQSKNVEVPHYYVMNECRVDNMLATIKALNGKSGGKYKITVNDYLIKAMARANLIVKACNSQWLGDCVRQFNTVDISVAVATPSGLLTPIIRNAHAKTLSEISMEAKSLAKKAREGTLSPMEYQGGTATISNLGGMGVPNFTAIINQPSSMILAVGTTQQKPDIIKNEQTGEFELTGKVAQVMEVTASFDHRVIDGATGAEWMKHFKDAIENPLSLLL